MMGSKENESETANDDYLINKKVSKESRKDMKEEKKEKKRKRKEEKKQKKRKRKKEEDHEEALPSTSLATSDKSDIQPTETGLDSMKSSETSERQPLDADNSSLISKSIPTQDDVKSLERAYQQALKDFKADKTNKDLRRARTAAKRAWESAMILSAQETNPNAEAFVCRNCSHVFVFEAHEEFEARGWVKPTQCKRCTFTIDRARSKPALRAEHDKKQNMCYDFQKTGVCSRGDRCKFSHAKDHVGKNRPLKPICHAFAKGECCPHGENCRFRYDHGTNDKALNDVDDDAIKTISAIKS